ncbi:MAG: hypothetical protein MJ252_08745 [archaeon]|nr:hypothetical protein [archaeon]
MSAKGLKAEDLEIDVIKAGKMVGKKGRFPLTFVKPTDYKSEDHYKSAREQHPSYSPDPCHYWKMKLKTVDTNAPPCAPEELTLPNGKTGKTYYLNHQRNDFRVYKPMVKSVY